MRCGSSYDWFGYTDGKKDFGSYNDDLDCWFIETYIDLVMVFFS